MTLHIRSSDMICGLPALTARKLMLCSAFRSNFGIRVEEMPDLTGCQPEEGHGILAALVKEGYLEAPECGHRLYSRSDKGKALAAAKAHGGFKRATCEKTLKGFLGRVSELQANPQMPNIVLKAIVFGSYLSDKPVLGDVDLFLELGPRYPENLVLQERLENERRHLFWEKGRTFSNVGDEVCWSLDEAKTFLKARSPILQFQPWYGKPSEDFLAPLSHKVLPIPEPNRSLLR